MTHRPALAVHIDWADDSYASPLADVTADLLAHQVACGIEVDHSDEALPVLPAEGEIVLNNKGGAYDPSTSAGLAGATLRTPHLLRIRYDGRTLWEGLAQPPVLESLQGRELARFRLVGRTSDPLLGDYERPLAAATRLDAFLAAPAFDHVMHPSGAAGVRGRYVFHNPQRTAPRMIRQTAQDGSLADWLQRFSIFAGAFVFEDALGRLNVIEPAAAAAGLTDPEPVASEANLRISRESVGFEMVGMVRNHARFEHYQAYEIVSVANPIPLAGFLDGVGPIFTADAYAEPPAPPGFTRSDYGTGYEIVGASGTPVRTVSGGGWGAGLESVSDSGIARVLLYGEHFGRYSFNVTWRIGVFPRTSRREYRIAASETTYGQRTTRPPDWFAPADFGRAEAWLQLRSAPLSVMRLVMPLWQEDAAASARVAGLAPGTTFRANLRSPNGLTRSERALVVGRVLTHELDSVPSVTITAIKVTDIEPANLTWDRGDWDEHDWH